VGTLQMRLANTGSGDELQTIVHNLNLAFCR
jgi:hypothetical protein